VLKLIEKHPDKKVITFKSHKEVDEYLEGLRSSYEYNI